MKRREIVAILVFVVAASVVPVLVADGRNPRGLYRFDDELLVIREKFKKQHGYWVSRTAEPAPDRMYLTLEKPMIEGNGEISMSRNDRIYYGALVPWQLNEFVPDILLFGRSIERGQVAFVSDPKIKVHKREPNVPAADRIKLDR
jgi:hypothetical protein